jgi:hypothetical protein
VPPFGAGFRPEHFDAIRGAPRAADWFEIVSDTFIGAGGSRRAMLEALRADFPILLHGLSLSIAGTEPLSPRYLGGLRELSDWVEPPFVSDHLCWTALGGHQSHDLLPIAYTDEVLHHVAARVDRVQETLRRPILLENPSAYVAFSASQRDEAEFLAELGRRTGCGVLLDLNNLYVNAANLGIDPLRYLGELARDSVGYFHLAGHAVLDDVRIDTHDTRVPEPVWTLFELASALFPQAGVIVEWDDRLPAFEVLQEEVAAARLRHRGGPASKAARGRPSKPAQAPGRPSGWEELRREFFARVIDKPLGFDHAPDAALDGLLDDRRPVRAARGMRVYSDAYTASLRRALATNFPGLACVLRGDDFAELAAAYLERHPPTSHAFQELGRRLPEFIASYRLREDYGVPRAVLSELAALEQAQLEVDGAPDSGNAVSGGDIAAIPPEHWADTRFAFASALRVVRADHDVLPVVEAVTHGESPERPEPRQVAYLVHRAGDLVHTLRLTPREADLLERLVAGRSLSDACAEAWGPGADADTAQVETAARLLLTAAARDLIVGFELPARGDQPRV